MVAKKKKRRKFSVLALILCRRTGETTFENVCLEIFSTVPLKSRCPRALTFQNVCLLQEADRVL